MHRDDFLHLRAPGNWINDPNGFIYYKGEYHLYYQYFPYAPQWGTMHWGHAVSRDLVSWEHRGLALFPSKPYDRNGCFSGSAQAEEEGISFYYTGVRYNRYDEENIHLSVNDDFDSSQVMITSQDGYHFDNFHDKKMIIPPVADPSIGSAAHTRDPKVWKEGDTYYMVLGSQTENEDGEMQGRLLFYRSRDGRAWEYAASYTDSTGGYMWECPDLFCCGGRYVLCMSPMGYLKDGYEYENISVCLPVSFDASECTLRAEGAAELMDYGMDLYAPQSTLDASGRRTIIGWMRMPVPVKEENGQEWIGMMSLPRLVEYRNGHICFRPHPDAAAVFKKETDVREIDYGKPFKINTSLAEGDSLAIGGFCLWQEDGRLMTDRSRVFGDVKGYRTRFSTPPLGGRCELEIFVDRNIIEVFVNDGEYVLSNIVYGLSGPTRFFYSRRSGCGSAPTGKPMVIFVP